MLRKTDPEQINLLSTRIRNRVAKRCFYQNSYLKYVEILGKCPPDGLVVELGSGLGFAKNYIKDLITTDIFQYPELDCVIDGRLLPFEDESVRLFCMLNVFHHISDVKKLLSEINRCLMHKGRILIIDQHNGIISRLILKFLHHEFFDEKAADWKFKSNDPLNGANGALAWIVFQRDLEIFRKEFPGLSLNYYKPHTPLLYWLSGGLKWWSLVPGILVKPIMALDNGLIKITEDFGSFVDIELQKK